MAAADREYLCGPELLDSPLAHYFHTCRPTLFSYLQAQGLKHVRATIVIGVRMGRLEILPNLTEHNKSKHIQMSPQCCIRVCNPNMRHAAITDSLMPCLVEEPVEHSECHARRDGCLERVGGARHERVHESGSERCRHPACMAGWTQPVSKSGEGQFEHGEKQSANQGTRGNPSSAATHELYTSSLPLIFLMAHVRPALVPMSTARLRACTHGPPDCRALNWAAIAGFACVQSGTKHRDQASSQPSFVHLSDSHLRCGAGRVDVRHRAKKISESSTGEGALQGDKGHLERRMLRRQKAIPLGLYLCWVKNSKPRDGHRLGHLDLVMRDCGESHRPSFIPWTSTFAVPRDVRRAGYSWRRLACASMLLDLSTLKSFGKKCVLKLHQTHRDETSKERILWSQQLGYPADVSISRALARLFEKKGAVAGANQALDVASREKEELKLGEAILGSEGWLRVRGVGGHMDPCHPLLRPPTIRQRFQKVPGELRPRPLYACPRLAVHESRSHGVCMQSAVIYVLANASRGFMHGLNKTTVTGGEVMEAALRRPEGQALITVCNHIAAMDDPLVMSAVIPPAFYSQPKSIRCVELQSPPA